MRNAFASTVIQFCNTPEHFFLTGDLGFMALEGVRDSFNERFINTGVSEQNMVGVAAGLAREGLKVFVYSIAPFCYARPFEQIRNDLCFGTLPVCLVGNGGGYAYGYMGPTHHALEDCAAMSALGVRVLTPAFDTDIPVMLSTLDRPTYLRLGQDAHPQSEKIPPYAPWRRILDGHRGAIAALGPLAGVAWSALLNTPIEKRPSIWAVTELVADSIPEEFWRDISNNGLYVIEEHVASGGLGMHLALAMAVSNRTAKFFTHRYALGYPTGRFGSQKFHRAQCGLDETGIRDLIFEHIQ